MATTFSANLNKIALLRNSRGENNPNLTEIATLVIQAGCRSITLHPRQDERHATLEDIQAIANMNLVQEKKIEINIEGDLRETLIHALITHQVNQFTIVPVTQGEKTTTRGWNKTDDTKTLTKVINRLQRAGIRISLFIEPDIDAVQYAAAVGAEAVELHTKWYAEAFNTPDEKKEIERIKNAAKKAKTFNLRVHLGHDLNLQNLKKIIEQTHPDEVSIGHALITESLILGLPKIVTQYIKLLSI